MTQERATSLLVAVWLCGFAYLAKTPPGARAEEPVYEVRVLQVWAGGEATAKGVPEELKPHAGELRRRTGEEVFVLAAKPASRTLKPGERVAIDLPCGYRGEWSVQEDGLSQTLTNPEKKRSTLLLKRSPVFTSVAKIRRGRETFQLVVEFRRPEA